MQKCGQSGIRVLEYPIRSFDLISPSHNKVELF